MLDQIRLLRLRDVRQLTGLSRSTIYRLQRAGTFPGCIKLSKQTTAWPAAEVAAVISARVAGKSDGDIRCLVAQMHGERVR